MIGAGQPTASILVTPIDDSAMEGNETVVATLSASASYSIGSPSTATVTIADNDMVTIPTVAFSFEGTTADRVGQSTTALSGDGLPDGVFTVTLLPGSGNRTVTQLRLIRIAGSQEWDTIPGGFWVTGAAATTAGSLFNAGNGTVNFPIVEDGSFKIFASDYQGTAVWNRVRLHRDRVVF